MSNKPTYWTRSLDSLVFYYLESWRASISDPSSTHYLTQIELYQRHMTTSVFKIAVGADLSSGISKSSRQNPVNPTLKHKIAKAFLDALYAFLDGLVLLASDESPISTGKMLDMETPTLTGSNPLEQLDLRNGVSHSIAKRVQATLCHDAGRPNAMRHFKFEPLIQSCHTQHVKSAGKCSGRCGPWW